MNIKNPNSFNGINVGDYCRNADLNYPLKLTKIDLFDNNHAVFEFENNGEKFRHYGMHCSKWIPVENEECLFYDDEKFHPILALYIKKENDFHFANVFDGKGNVKIIEFKYCKPTPIRNKVLI